MTPRQIGSASSFAENQKMLLQNTSTVHGGSQFSINMASRNSQNVKTFVQLLVDCGLIIARSPEGVSAQRMLMLMNLLRQQTKMGSKMACNGHSQ